MPDAPLCIRRCRRTDFIEVMRLLAVDEPAAVAERRTLRRFRNLVNDLGVDLYVALLDDAIAGIVHVSYVRQLAATPRAQVERLIVTIPSRGHGVGSALFEFARRRAIRRGCGTLVCSIPADTGAAIFLEKVGLRREGQRFVTEFPALDGSLELGAGRQEQKIG